MGQFKPMVKMMTTEPTVELKLAKGGAVKMKKGGSTTNAKKMAMGGGAMDMMAGTPALLGRPAVNAPVRSPMKPSMAMRRKAMMAKPATTPSGPSMGMPAMKKGGKADMAQDKAMIKKAFKQHDMQEHKGGKGTALKLKKGGMKKFATGGSIPSEETYGSYDTTLVHQAKPDNSPAKTGGVRYGNAGGFKKGGKTKFATGGVAKSNAGGYATGGAIPSETTNGSYDTTLMHQAKPDRSKAVTGGVRNGNAGGFKMGGKTSKKAYATGGTVDSGRPVAMPQGNKPVPAPVAISRLSGTYKKGGKVTPAESRLLKNNAAENFMSMRDAHKDSNLKYGSPKRMNGGGSSSDFDAKAVSDKASRELEEALNPLSMAKELYGKVRDSKFVKDISDTASDYGDLWMKGAGLRSQNAPNPRSVTKTKESVTVSPAGKKRGGRAC